MLIKRIAQKATSTILHCAYNLSKAAFVPTQQTPGMHWLVEDITQQTPTCNRTRGESKSSSRCSSNLRWPPLLLPLFPGSVDQTETAGKELGDFLSTVMHHQALGPLITTALVLRSKKGFTNTRNKDKIRTGTNRKSGHFLSW